MAATAEDQLVSAPRKTVRFASVRSNLRLVRVPRYPIMAEGGRKVGENPGEAIAFQNAMLEVPQDGEFVLEDGRTTDAAGVMEWLMSHRLYGDATEGFFRVNEAAPPISHDELKTIMAATSRLDVETLEKIADQEEAGWNREEIVTAARESAQEIRAIREAEAAKQKPTGTK